MLACGTVRHAVLISVRNSVPIYSPFFAICFKPLVHLFGDKLIRHKNIINYIKAQRLSWFGHLQRVSEERMVKKSVQLETEIKKTTRETKEQMGR